MKIGENGKKPITITLIVLMTLSSILFVGNTEVQAQVGSYPQPVAGPLPSGVTPNSTLSVVGAYLSVTPGTIGVGQELLVNMWIIPPTQRNRAFIQAFELTITKPDGTKEVMGPVDSFCGDGTAWLGYTPKETGTYKFVFDFLGQYFQQDITTTE
jgi:hypothetical protein